jgi:hypothetical protein
MKMPTGVTSRALGFLSVAPAIFHLLAIDARHVFFQTAVAVVFGRPDRPFWGGVSVMAENSCLSPHFRLSWR